MRAVRITLEHAGHVEIPHGRARHHQQSQRAEDCKIHSRVDLFHKAVLFGARPDLEVDRHGSDEALHEELSREGQHDYIKSHKRNIFQPFAIIPGSSGIVAGGERDRRV